MMIRHFLLTLLIIFAFNNIENRTTILVASANLNSKQQSLHYIQQSSNNTLNDDLSFNINLEDLKESPKDSEKYTSETEHLFKALSDDEELKNIKFSDLKANEDSDVDSHSCEDIKKLGQQKEYCEKKFLLSEGEEKTVECMKEFCTVCCEGDDQCQASCSKSHALFSDHDPEDMFINVCSYKNMGPSFEGFCKSMIIDDDKKEYEQCISNFCFDCCSNELKINDFKDPEINKCIGKCKPPQGVDMPKVPVTEQIKQETAMITEELEKLKSNNDETVTNKDIESENESIKQDKIMLNIPELNNDNPDGNKTSNIKVLVDFTKNKPTLEEEQNKSKSKTIKDSMESNKIINHKPEAEAVDRKIKVNKVVEDTSNNSTMQNDISKERKRENLQICESLILAFTNIKQFGKNINRHCINNYAVNFFENSNDCLKNLCGECCNFLDIDKEIKTCLTQCHTAENKELTTTKSSQLINEDLSFVNTLKQILSRKKEKEAKFQTIIPKASGVPAVEIQKKIAENGEEKIPMDYNMIYFSLMRNLCNIKYFLNCQETMCSEYCNDSFHIINQKCLVECTKYTSLLTQEKGNSYLFDYILKKHGYYEAEYEILNQRSKSDKESTNFSQSGSHLNSSIDQKKEVISKLKSQLMKEEMALLNLYKMNKN